MWTWITLLLRDYGSAVAAASGAALAGAVIRGSRRLVEAKAALDSFTEVMTALQAGQVQQSETNAVFREDLDGLTDRLDREFPAGGTPFRDRLSTLEAKVSTILELLRSAHSIDNPGVA